jgi:hypothetical protein
VPVASTEYAKVAEFILRLQEDLKFIKEFNNDPDTIMTEFGISSDEIKVVLKSNDMLRIRHLLALALNNKNDGIIN